MPKNFTCNYGDADALYNNFFEITLDPSLLNNFANEDSMGAYFNNYSASEDFQKLKLELIKEIMKIIENNLTEKQKAIIKLTYMDGKTQNEISSMLGRHQTAVHKALQGNIDYNNDRKRYGGAIKKIKKLCKENEKIQTILAKMKEKREEFSGENI